MSKKPAWRATSVCPPLPNSLCVVALHPDAGHYHSVWNGKNWSTFAHFELAAIDMRHQPFVLKKAHETYYLPVRVLPPLSPLSTAITTRSIMSFNSASARCLGASDLPAFFGNAAAVFRQPKQALPKPSRQPVRPTTSQRLAKAPQVRASTKSQPVPSAWGPKGQPAGSVTQRKSRAPKLELSSWINLAKQPPSMSGAYEVRMRDVSNNLLVDVLKWSDEREAFLKVPKGFAVKAYRGLTKAAFKAQQALV